MDISYYESRKMDLLDEIFDFDAGDDDLFADDYFEVRPWEEFHHLKLYLIF